MGFLFELRRLLKVRDVVGSPSAPLARRVGALRITRLRRGHINCVLGVAHLGENRRGHSMPDNKLAM